MPRITRRRITEEWVEQAEEGETLDGVGFVEEDQEDLDPDDREPAAEEKSPRRRRTSR